MTDRERQPRASMTEPQVSPNSRRKGTQMNEAELLERIRVLEAERDQARKVGREVLAEMERAKVERNRLQGIVDHGTMVVVSEETQSIVRELDCAEASAAEMRNSLIEIGAAVKLYAPDMPSIKAMLERREAALSGTAGKLALDVIEAAKEWLAANLAYENNETMGDSRLTRSEESLRAAVRAMEGK